METRARQPHLTAPHLPRKSFSESWKIFSTQKKVMRFLLALGIGTAAFSMQDIILEPYGAEVLKLSVSSTTMLTFITAVGAICAFAIAAKFLNRSIEAYRLAALGTLFGILAFTCVIFSEPLASPLLFRCGAFLIGFGGGLFSVSTLTVAMSFEADDMSGLVLGAWGAVQATAAGLAIALGGFIRDLISGLAQSGLLGSALDSNATGYSFVYHLEFYLLFATLIVLGPLVAYRTPKLGSEKGVDKKFGLAELPG